MKIFYVNPMSRNNLAQYDEKLLESLSNKKNKVIIQYICSENIDYQLNNVIKVPIFNYFNYETALLKALSYSLTLAKLFLRVSKEKPDLIHFQWLKIPTIDLILLLIFEKFFGIRCMLTVHNLMPHQPNFLDKLIFPIIYRCISGLFVHENRARKNLVHTLGVVESHITTICHGPLALKPKISQPLSNDIAALVSNSQNILLCMGRLSYYKGIDLLIESWRSIPSEHLQCFTLVFAGKADSSISSTTKSQIQSHPSTLWINRYLSDTDLYHLIESCQAIIIPYRKISQSGVLFTAIGHRKAVLVTDIGGLTEPLEVANVGWFSAPDVEPLTTTIAEMCETLSQGNPVCESDWQRIEQRFSWDKAAEKTIAGYKKIRNLKKK